MTEDQITDDHGDAWGDHAQPPDGWRSPQSNIFERDVMGCRLTVSLARDVWYLVVSGDVHYPGIRLPGVKDGEEARSKAVAELRRRLGAIVDGLHEKAPPGSSEAGRS